VFPLAHALVMPETQLPLNIFEPRYLNMVFDSLAGGRLIGMVQPDASPVVLDGVYRVGTAGLITSFSETTDGRLLIVLTGVCRFRILEEITTVRGYRRMRVDWSEFRSDYAPEPVPVEARLRLVGLLRAYARIKGVDADWKVLEGLETARLVNLLAGQLPFSVEERQLLVESVSTGERVSVLSALLSDPEGSLRDRGRPH
jgi:Lon protease-like protein